MIENIPIIKWIGDMLFKISTGYKENIQKEKELLRSIKSDLTTLKNIYIKGSLYPDIIEDNDEIINFTYDLNAINYFQVFDNCADKLGIIQNEQIINSINDAYHKGKSLYTSLKINNEQIERFWNLEKKYPNPYSKEFRDNFYYQQSNLKESKVKIKLEIIALNLSIESTEQLIEEYLNKLK